MDKDLWKVALGIEDGMSFNEYQALAQRTSKDKGFREKLDNGALGLTGEAGEVADIVKKYLHQDHPLDQAAIVKELGDVLWYVAETCAALGVQMEEVAKLNIKKLYDRYPQGFSADRSINRSE